MCVCVSSRSLWGGWADVGLWVAVCFLAKIYIGVHVKPRLHAWHSHRQSRSHQSRFHLFQIKERYDFFFIFRNSFFIQNYRFLYHGDQKISWWTSMQVAGNQLRNPPVKFRQERWLHIWRSICIQHVQMEAGLNSDPGNDSFSDKIRDAKHVDRSTHYSTCRSTQVKSASTDLWPQEMFTFSEMLALFRVGKQFRCLRLS